MTPPPSQVTILHEVESIGDPIAHAGKGMYETSESGRDRVVSYG